MAAIKQNDLIQSVADALQYISYYHPVDFIQAVHEAYLREESPAARDAMAQILINSRMCATGHRPICQDTGIVTVFVKVGMNVRWDDATMGLDDKTSTYAGGTLLIMLIVIIRLITIYYLILLITYYLLFATTYDLLLTIPNSY